MKDVRIARSQPGVPTKTDDLLPQGADLPYLTKLGFPVFLFDGATFGDEYEYMPPPPGTVGVDLHNLDLYVIDTNGLLYSLGLTLPAVIKPQPLEVDYDHPFFAAAKRAMDKAAVPDETPEETAT